MSEKENPIFEKRGDNNQIEILVLQLADETHINNPDLDNLKIEEVCKSFGIRVFDLRKLFKKEPDLDGYQDVEGPSDYTIPPHLKTSEEVEEEFRLRIVTIPDIGKTEISTNILHSTAIKKQDNIGVHIVDPDYQGNFEIFYGLQGSFILSIPETVQPIALGVYGSSPQRTDIEVKPGTAVFIRAKIPNGWTAVTKEPCM